MANADDHDDDEVAKLKAMGVQFHEGIPILPFEPDAIVESRFYLIEAGDLPTDADVQDLIQRMWLEPECAFYYYYSRSGKPARDPALMRASSRNDILMNKTERRYYKHPRFRRDYVRVTPLGDGRYEFEWEKEVVDKGPEFWRVTLELSPRKRAELDAWRKVQLEEHYRQQVRRTQYAYDVFLSHSSPDATEAQEIHEKIKAAGYRSFLAPKAIKPGDDFAESIRLALHGSRELWLLVSPSSSRSEWVISEWGAAWALGKRIVPILHRCAPDTLPERLAKLQCIDLHRVHEVIRQLGPAPS